MADTNCAGFCPVNAVNNEELAAAERAAQALVGVGKQRHSTLLTALPSQLPGVKTLARRIKTEINVLIKGLQRTSWLKMEHVSSSNLHQLGAVVQLATALQHEVLGVLHKFRDEDGTPVFVDIVANGGLLWIKVVCRCPNTLQLSHLTGGRAGERTPVEQAVALLRLAASHPVLYSKPQVAFVFCKGVSSSVQSALQQLGVLVLSPRIIPDQQLTASRYNALLMLDDFATELDHNSDTDSLGSADGHGDWESTAMVNGGPSREEESARKQWPMCSEEDLSRIASHIKSLSIKNADLAMQSSQLNGDRRQCITSSPAGADSNTDLGDQSAQPCLKTDLTDAVGDLTISSHPLDSNTVLTQSMNTLGSGKCTTSCSSLERCNDVHCASERQVPEVPRPVFPCQPRVCLDVPCLIAYVSNVSNGFCDHHFQDKFLREQAQWERALPVKAVIEGYWRGAEVLVCAEAVMRFNKITAVMAGPAERDRADQLLARVTVVPDQDDLEARLKVCGGFNASTRTIFGTALHHRAPIITANKRLVRSAASQGVQIAALFHSPRALTEIKQQPAAATPEQAAAATTLQPATATTQQPGCASEQQPTSQKRQQLISVK